MCGFKRFLVFKEHKSFSIHIKKVGMVMNNSEFQGKLSIISKVHKKYLILKFILFNVISISFSTTTPLISGHHPLPAAGSACSNYGPINKIVYKMWT